MGNKNRANALDDGSGDMLGSQTLNPHRIKTQRRRLEIQAHLESKMGRKTMGYLNPLFLCVHLWLQGLFSMVNNASAIYVMRYSPPGAKIGTFEIAGAIVWLMGQLMEIIGDKQL